MKNIRNDKFKIIVFLIALIASFSIFLAARAANNLDNNVAIYEATMTGIKTGTYPFSSYPDGLSGDSTSVDGYVAGRDNNDYNRIILAFDALTYNFNYSIAHKNSDEDITDRKVNITVNLSEEEAKYITFDKYSKPGETSHTFTFDHKKQV